MKTILWAVMLCMPLSSFASDAKHCLFTGSIETVDRLPVLGETVHSDQKTSSYAEVLSFKPSTAKKLDGSYVDCQSYIGKSHRIAISKEEVGKHRADSSVSIEFQYSDGLSPDGVSRSETWKIKR